jgi:RNA polymerase sigma-70 factor, ECF subfamily
MAGSGAGMGVQSPWGRTDTHVANDQELRWPETPADDLPMRTLLEERGLLLGYINVIVRDLHAAEDILQEALVIALRQRFEHVDHARAWIRVTARNLALNESRRKQRRAGMLSDEVLELLEPTWRAEGDGPSHGERLAALRSCCEQLSDAGKRLIDLRYHQNLDGEGIAEALGRPLNTVYVGLSRVYRRLAGCIETRLGRA